MPVIAAAAVRVLRPRTAGRAAAHGEIMDAVDTVYRAQDSMSCFASSCRSEGGNSGRTSRQRVLPVFHYGRGLTSWYRAAGQAAANEVDAVGDRRHHCTRAVGQAISHGCIVAVVTACHHHSSSAQGSREYGLSSLRQGRTAWRRTAEHDE